MAKKRISISPTGNISTPVGPVTASVNPVTGSAGVGANVFQSGDVGVNVGAGIGPTGVQIGPSVQIGKGTGSQVGGAAGSALGAAVGGPVGAFVGSAAGSAAGSLATSSPAAGIGTALFGPTGGLVGGAVGSLFGGDSKASKEHDSRNGVRDQYKGTLYDGNYQLPLPDGTVANFGQDGQSGTHNWTNPKNNKSGITRPLFSYETDTSNDTDYVAGMAGITLSRLLGGTKNKATDQFGAQIGNQALGTVGYGSEFNQKNFNSVMTNMRAIYAKSGVSTKADALALANKMFADGRVTDADHAVMLQTANMVFDNNFNQAQSLMSNRNQGIQLASQTPSASGNLWGTQQNVPGRVFSPILSPEEAFLSVKPYLDYMQAHQVKPPPQSAGQSLASALGLISAFGAANAATTKLTGKSIIGNIVGAGKDLAKDIGLTSTDTNQSPDSSDENGPNSEPPADVPDTVDGSGGDGSSIVETNI